MKILDYIVTCKKERKKLLAILIDPDKINDTEKLIGQLKQFPPDLIFVGGSQLDKVDFDRVIDSIFAAKICPVLIFPGAHDQISDQSDALLLLSLISGRNPEYLIGQHVKAAKRLSAYSGDIIPTSYLLIDGNRETSVQQVSETNPINQDDINLICDTIAAGKFLGHQLHYLEAGSGANQSVSTDIISNVTTHSSHPIIVGGGIKDANAAIDIWKSGADIIVVGNGFEDSGSLLEKLLLAKREISA